MVIMHYVCTVLKTWTINMYLLVVSTPSKKYTIMNRKQYVTNNSKKCAVVYFMAI